MPDTSPEQRWYCNGKKDGKDCKWVGVESALVTDEEIQCRVCPNCSSEQVFMDEELMCEHCKVGQYGPNQQNSGGDWYRIGDLCPNQSQRCPAYMENELIPKPPRELNPGSK